MVNTVSARARGHHSGFCVSAPVGLAPAVKAVCLKRTRLVPAWPPGRGAHRLPSGAVPAYWHIDSCTHHRRPLLAHSLQSLSRELSVVCPQTGMLTHSPLSSCNSILFEGALHVELQQGPVERLG